MMTFVGLTLSFTVAILLASGLAFALMMQPKVMKWYMKKMFKMTKDMEDAFEEMAEDL